MKNPVEVKVSENESSVLFDADKIVALSTYVMDDAYLRTRYYLQLSMLKPEDGVLLKFSTKEERDTVYSRLLKEIGVEKSDVKQLLKELRDYL